MSTSTTSRATTRTTSRSTTGRTRTAKKKTSREPAHPGWLVDMPGGLRNNVTLALVAGYGAAMRAVSAVNRARSAAPLIEVLDRHVTASAASRADIARLARYVVTMQQHDLDREPFIVLGAAGEAALELVSLAGVDAADLITDVSAIPAAAR